MIRVFNVEYCYPKKALNFCKRVRSFKTKKEQLAFYNFVMKAPKYSNIYKWTCYVY